MCWNQLLLAGLSTGSVYFLTVPSDHTVVLEPVLWEVIKNRTSTSTSSTGTGPVPVPLPVPVTVPVLVFTWNVTSTFWRP